MTSRPLLALLLAGTLAGCGETGEESSRAPAASVTAETNPAQTVPSVAAETATATVPAATASTAQAPTAKGGGEPNAGDEEAIRVPAQYVVARGRLRPRSVFVPAYLRVELSVRNRDAATVAVTFRGRSLRVPAGAVRSLLVDGLRPGRYALRGSGGARAVLVSGAEPGP